MCDPLYCRFQAHEEKQNAADLFTGEQRLALSKHGSMMPRHPVWAQNV